MTCHEGLAQDLQRKRIHKIRTPLFCVIKVIMHGRLSRLLWNRRLLSIQILQRLRCLSLRSLAHCLQSSHPLNQPVVLCLDFFKHALEGIHINRGH